MTVTCYTDASYSHEKNISACGFCVLVGGKMVKHEISLVEGLGGPGQSEVYAITAALQYAFLMEGVTGIILHTDFMPIITRRHDKKRTGNRRPKLDYQDFYDTVEVIKEHNIWIRITYVNAHADNWVNNLVDEACRQNLRKVVSGKDKCNGKQSKRGKFRNYYPPRK